MLSIDYAEAPCGGNFSKHFEFGAVQHAPAEEPLRSAVLARAAREISILTQRSLAALLLSAEPRPVVV